MLILLAVLYAVCVFLIQTMLFRKTSRKILHAIPLMGIGGIYIIALFLPLADSVMTELGRNDGYSFYSFAALLTAGINTLGLFADGAAWLVEKV